MLELGGCADRGDARGDCRPAQDQDRRDRQAVDEGGRSGRQRTASSCHSRWRKCMAVALAAREERMSMLEDLTRGGPLKIDGLACAIAKMRKLVGHDAHHRHGFSTSRACTVSEKSDPNTNPATADRSTPAGQPLGLRFNSRRGCPNVKPQRLRRLDLVRRRIAP